MSLASELDAYFMRSRELFLLCLARSLVLVISLWTHTPSSLAALSIVFTSAACAARVWDAAARPRRASPTELGATGIGATGRLSFHCGGGSRPCARTSHGAAIRTMRRPRRTMTRSRRWTLATPTAAQVAWVNVCMSLMRGDAGGCCRDQSGLPQRDAQTHTIFMNRAVVYD